MTIVLILKKCQPPDSVIWPGFLESFLVVVNMWGQATLGESASEPRAGVPRGALARFGAVIQVLFQGRAEQKSDQEANAFWHPGAIHPPASGTSGLWTPCEPPESRAPFLGEPLFFGCGTSNWLLWNGFSRVKPPQPGETAVLLSFSLPGSLLGGFL